MVQKSLRNSAMSLACYLVFIKEESENHKELSYCEIQEDQRLLPGEPDNLMPVSYRENCLLPQQVAIGFVYLLAQAMMLKHWNMMSFCLFVCLFSSSDYQK